jgi:hypothetical protein
VVLPELPGKGLVRQRSIFADLIFCYFFIEEKSNGAPRPRAGQALRANALKRYLDEMIAS